LFVIPEGDLRLVPGGTNAEGDAMRYDEYQFWVYILSNRKVASSAGFQGK